MATSIGVLRVVRAAGYVILRRDMCAESAVAFRRRGAGEPIGEPLRGRRGRIAADVAA